MRYPTKLGGCLRTLAEATEVEVLRRDPTGMRIKK